MQLDARNQANFDQLERIYLYDIPEYDDSGIVVTCAYCENEFCEDNIERLDGDYCCKECAKQLYTDKVISREEFEQIYGEI